MTEELEKLNKYDWKGIEWYRDFYKRFINRRFEEK